MVHGSSFSVRRLPDCEARHGAFQLRMPQLTRKRVNNRPERWYIHFAAWRDYLPKRSEADFRGMAPGRGMARGEICPMGSTGISWGGYPSGMNRRPHLSSSRINTEWIDRSPKT